MWMPKSASASCGQPPMHDVGQLREGANERLVQGTV
jgi:hypothetical protein